MKINKILQIEYLAHGCIIHTNIQYIPAIHMHAYQYTNIYTTNIVMF